MLLLTLFALGILMIDLLLPPQWKVLNAWTAFAGLVFAGVAVYRTQHFLAGHAPQPGFSGSLLIDHFAIYFFYLFLMAAAVTILMLVRYLDIENEPHGEFYSLLLFSVIGMMCMAAGYDLVILFIGLELMAISTYVLVGFLRR